MTKSEQLTDLVSYLVENELVKTDTNTENVDSEETTDSKSDSDE